MNKLKNNLGEINPNWWNITLGISLLVYGAGLFINIMEPDAATYAIISMEMLDRQNFMEITARGLDWLDKPHFPFWVTALSLKIFGFNNVGFKLPAIVFTLIGLLYTYKFGKRFYSAKTGYIATLILMTSLHLILSNSDVRAEPFLLAETILSLYYFAIFLEEKKWYQLVLGSLGLGCLLMTKGLFTIIPVGAAVLFQLAYRGKWKEILHWQWIVAGLLTFIFILPVLYSYYHQFDLHPEKEILGQNGVSGIKFFLWDSQWGRFTNSGPIKGQGDPFFFLHTLLWAFAPWAFLAYFALFVKTKNLILRKNSGESYTYFGFVFLVLIFSVSRFQLPHYVVPLFPFLAILTANELSEYVKNEKFGIVFTRIHFYVSVLLIITATIFHYYFSGKLPSIDTIVLALFIIGLITVIYRSNTTIINKILFPPALSVLLVMYYMNRNFYPQLMKYQSESEVAFYLKKNGIPSHEFLCLDRNEWVTDFYLHETVPVFWRNNVNNDELIDKYVFCNDEGIETLKQLGKSYDIVKVFPDFHVTMVTPSFINKKTRESTLTNNYLIHVND